MPSRILRDGINSSARINALSDGAEILYRRLMSVVDDYGRFYAAAQTVLGACWPTSPDKISVNQVRSWMQELTKGENPLVMEYAVSGCHYLQITDFRQKIRTKSKFPDPCPQFVDNLSADCQQIVDSLPADCPQSVDKMPALGVMRNAICVMREASGGVVAHSDRLAPENLEERIRSLAAQATDPSDFEPGVSAATQAVLTSANPETTLKAMEENMPLWWAAQREGRARVKIFRYSVVDGDYLHRPRSPTSKADERKERILQTPNPRLRHATVTNAT